MCRVHMCTPHVVLRAGGHDRKIRRQYFGGAAISKRFHLHRIWRPTTWELRDKAPDSLASILVRVLARLTQLYMSMRLQGPKSWQIDLHINEGEVEEAYVRLSDSGEWKDFDIEDSSIETIESLFDTGGELFLLVRLERKERENPLHAV